MQVSYVSGQTCTFTTSTLKKIIWPDVHFQSQFNAPLGISNQLKNIWLPDGSTVLNGVFHFCFCLDLHGKSRAAYCTVLWVWLYKIQVFYGYFTCKLYCKAIFFILRWYGTGKKMGIQLSYGARRHLKILRKQKMRHSNHLLCLQGKISLCFTNMSVWIVSGLRLVQQRDIVSCPPEKIRSTATADPKQNYLVNIFYKMQRKCHTGYRKKIVSKMIELRKLWTLTVPPLKWVNDFWIFLQATPEFK